MRQVFQTSFFELFQLCLHPTYNLWVMSGENLAKVIPLQILRFCNINSSLNLEQKAETVKDNTLWFGLSLSHSKTVVH